MNRKIPWVGYKVYQSPFAVRLEANDISIERIVNVEEGYAGISVQKYPLVIVSEIFPVGNMKLPDNVSSPVDISLFVIERIKIISSYNTTPLLVTFDEKIVFDKSKYTRAGATHFYDLSEGPQKLVDLVRNLI